MSRVRPPSRLGARRGISRLSGASGRFQLRSRGLQTARDAVAYDWNRETLSERMKSFIADYNAEVYRHRADSDANWPDHVNWSRDLKQDALRGNLAAFRSVNRQKPSTTASAHAPPWGDRPIPGKRRIRPQPRRRPRLHRPPGRSSHPTKRSHAHNSGKALHSTRVTFSTQANQRASAGSADSFEDLVAQLSIALVELLLRQAAFVSNGAYQGLGSEHGGLLQPVVEQGKRRFAHAHNSSNQLIIK